MKPFATGAIPRVKKKTDYKVSSYKKIGGSAAPEVVSPIPLIYMQNQEPCCGEDAATMARNILLGITGSPMMAWKTLRKIDSFPDSAGSTTTGIGSQAKNIGVSDLSLMPDLSTLSNADYAAYTGMTQAILDNAAPRKVDSFAFDDGPFTIASLQSSIALHKAVVLRINLGTGFWINSQGVGSWGTDLFPLKLGTYDDDHFICITDPLRAIVPIPNINPNYIYFVNSWSEEWGFHGWGWFDASYLPYVKEMLVFNYPPTPTNPNPPKYHFTQFMMYGMTSPDIHQLQIVLGVPSTGFFGVQTLTAVANWQRAHGLFPWGLVLQNMRDILNS